MPIEIPRFWALTTAAIAVAAREAATPEFKHYAERVVSNAKALAKAHGAHRRQHTHPIDGFLWGLPRATGSASRLS